MNLMTLLKNITVHLIRLDTTALINPLSQQFNKLLRNLNSLNTTTGKLTTPQFPCKFSKKHKYRQLPLLKQSLLILSSFVLITSCAPSADTAAPPDNPTLLANLIKESNLSTISGLTVTADNSDPANPKLTITGITNSSNTAPVTATITIDQSKGITTDPASFTVTTDSPISPYSTNTALTVTFEGEDPVSYTVTTQISGAAVKDWIVNEKLSEYITVSFGGQSGNLSVADRILSITGLTNIPTGTGTGEITFTLPTGFTSDQERIEIPNPAGTESATSTPNPNTFTITETDNTGNSETYTIADIGLAKLSRFTPSIHIKVAEGGTDITSSLTITEEANNMIRIVGLTNKVDQTTGTPNTYTLTIKQVSDFFTTPAEGSTINRTITEPAVDISAGTGTVDRDTFELTNSGESTATIYTLIVEFSAAAVSDWFTAASLSTYITAASFGAESGTLTLDGTNLLLSGGSNFTNVPNGMVALTIGTLPGGYSLTGAEGLMDPDGPGLAAVDAGSAGTITILETDKPANKQDYPVMITLGAYRSPLTADNITATYGGASPSDITIDTNMITISGFTNKNTNPAESGMVTFPTISNYTIESSPLTIPDPEGESATTANLEITVTDTRDGGVAVPHPVTVNFFGKIQLSITGNDVMDNTVVSSGGTITITTAACELLATPTVTVVGVSGSKVADTTPFPLYYDRDRDPSVMTTSGTLTGYTVTRRLTLEDGNSNVIGTDFAVTMVFPACTTFAVGTGNDADNAYVIDNAPRLELASYLVNNSNGTMPMGTGSTNTYGASHYKITASINMGLPGLPLSEVGSRHPNEMGTNGKGFLPIGRGNARFSGTLDCDSKTISNLYINRPGEANVGLIGALGVQMGLTPIPGTVQNCFLNDVKITGKNDVGGLVGLSQFVGSMISNSYATGVVVGNSGNIGGLVGRNLFSTINDSYATGAVSTQGGKIGGLAGLNDFGTINRSYATGTVRGGSEATGGLVGDNSGGEINDSYATGAVSAQRGNIGGLAGAVSGTINRSYATGTVSGGSNLTGGLVGSSVGSTVSDSYWNTETSGQSASASGTGRTTAQMQVGTPPQSGTDAVYVGWDTSIWNFTNGQYPRLINVVCANRQYNQDAAECTDL